MEESHITKKVFPYRHHLNVEMDINVSVVAE